MSIRDGICPECGSKEIYTRSGWFNNVIVLFMPPKTQIYVCGQCGYIAEFVQEGKPLQHIKDKWEKLDSPDKAKNDQL
jgi:DNA-directed RNA polymerase subunit RPC12/RpoP